MSEGHVRLPSTEGFTGCQEVCLGVCCFFPFLFTRGVTVRSLVCTLVLVVKIWYIFLAQQEKPTTFCGHNSYFKNLGADTGIFLIKINNTLRPVDNS